MRSLDGQMSKAILYPNIESFHLSMCPVIYDVCWVFCSKNSRLSQLLIQTYMKPHIGYWEAPYYFPLIGHELNIRYLYDTVNELDAPVKYSLGESFVFFDDPKCLSR